MSGFKRASTPGNTKHLNGRTMLEPVLEKPTETINLEQTQEIVEDTPLLDHSEDEEEPSFEDDGEIFESLFREEAKAWLTEFGPKLYSIEYSRQKANDAKKSLCKTLQKKSSTPETKKRKRS